MSILLILLISLFVVTVCARCCCITSEFLSLQKKMRLESRCVPRFLNDTYRCRGRPRGQCNHPYIRIDVCSYWLQSECGSSEDKVYTFQALYPYPCTCSMDRLELDKKQTLDHVISNVKLLVL